MQGAKRRRKVEYTYTHTHTHTHRVRINYRRILQNHIFTNTEQKYMMLLPFERGMFAVSCLDGQHSEFSLSGLQKLEKQAKKCIELRGEYVE